MIIGTALTSIGGGSNDLLVYDGGYVSCGGTVTVPNGADCPNNSFHMGGVGAMSTGIALVVNNNTAATNSAMFVSNAVFSASIINFIGVGGNTLDVLANGTLLLTNQSFAPFTGPTVIVTNVVRFNPYHRVLEINL